ncbi:MAG: hypothetical protein ABI885_17855 [Gammaproteobacteria bacterium]
MVCAIGGTQAYRVTPQQPGRSSAGGASTTALQAQISRDEVKLADWLSCVSAGTPEGKAHIQAISTELAAAKAQMEAVPASSSNTPVPSLGGSSSVSGSLDVWA